MSSVDARDSAELERQRRTLPRFLSEPVRPAICSCVSSCTVVSYVYGFKVPLVLRRAGERQVLWRLCVCKRSKPKPLLATDCSEAHKLNRILSSSLVMPVKGQRAQAFRFVQTLTSLDAVPLRRCDGWPRQRPAQTRAAFRIAVKRSNIVGGSLMYFGVLIA
jgi:hypothetical protein